MLNFLKPKKKFILSDQNKKRIESEIESLAKLKDGMFVKTKEFEFGFYINIIIDKRILGIEFNEEDKNVPDFLTFLLIVDSFYPEQAPKILTKSNFSFPSLMDGRDLSSEICPNWTANVTLIDIANSIPKFIIKILTAKVTKFYGKFLIGAIYDLKNFNNMSVYNFNCKFEKNPFGKKDDDGEYTMILSDDALVMFENYENNPTTGRIVFWSTLYSITDLQVNKMQKIASITFYNEETSQEKQLKFSIDNILFFREALVKRMSGLKVKVEPMKIIKGQQTEKRLSNKQINTMSITSVVENINILKQKIENNEINYYIVNTFTKLCSMAIEYYSAKNDDSHMTYLQLMKTVLLREDVQKITQGDK